MDVFYKVRGNKGGTVDIELRPAKAPYHDKYQLYLCGVGVGVEKEDVKNELFSSVERALEWYLQSEHHGQHLLATVNKGEGGSFTLGTLTTEGEDLVKALEVREGRILQLETLLTEKGEGVVSGDGKVR
jgi:hypothetical protein